MGRRRQVVPDYEKLLPAALEAYTNLENQLQTPLLHPAEIIDVHRSTEEAHFFGERATELPEFLQPKILIGSALELDAGWGATVTNGGFLLDLRTSVLGYKAHLKEQGKLIVNTFMADAVTPLAGRLQYAGESFSHIVLCNGIHALETPPFERLPLSGNKGQALIIQTDADLPPHSIYKWGGELSLVPMGEGHYWAGASFEWNYTDVLPTEVYRQQSEMHLHRHFPYPFQVLKQLSGLRTSALDRRPIAGCHPLYKNWGIVNAMGTKGVLQAPWLVREMADVLTECGTISNANSVNRFARLL
jgi:glycine/D-amino acid oxidase-like deaminating enzyme